MTQSSFPQLDTPELPENVAQALISGTDCEAVIEHRVVTGDPVISVPRIEEADDVGTDSHSALYRIGDGYVIVEGSGEDISESIAIEADQLPRYLEAIFDGEPKRVVHKTGADVWWLDSLSV